MKIKDIKYSFEANLLDGDNINDCGGAMISAKYCWEFIESSLTSLLDSLEKEVKENSPAYDGEALDTNNNRRWYEQGFGENRQEVINIINSHR